MANVFNLSGTADVISQVMPDIITLQEVDNVTQRHPVDEVAFLSSHTHMPYTEFAPWRPFQGGQYGIAILSRHPILEVKRHQYTKPSNRNELGDSRSEEAKCEVQKSMDFCQGILAVKIAPESFPAGIWIVTTHISADGAQQEEAKQLVNYVKGLLVDSGVKEALVTGDFNEAPNGLGPSYIAKIWHDSFSNCYHNPSNPHGFTFNSENPDRRIDYVWATSLRSCKRAWTLNTQASDHLPFIVQWG